MQTKNYEEVSNGDNGTVTSITNTDEGPLVTVDFGDGRAVEYDSSKLELLDLAYAPPSTRARGRSTILSLSASKMPTLSCSPGRCSTRPSPGRKSG